MEAALDVMKQYFFFLFGQAKMWGYCELEWWAFIVKSETYKSWNYIHIDSQSRTALFKPSLIKGIQIKINYCYIFDMSNISSADVAICKDHTVKVFKLKMLFLKHKRSIQVSRYESKWGKMTREQQQQVQSKQNVEMMMKLCADSVAKLADRYVPQIGLWMDGWTSLMNNFFQL